MNITKHLLALFASAALASPAIAADFRDDKPARPMDETKQANLLEKYGDQGIDADGDGALTRNEVRAFFADLRLDGNGGRPGLGGADGWGKHHGARGKGICMDVGKGMGMGKGRGMGGVRGVHRLLEHMEKLDAPTAPPQFDLTRHPDADLNGDGELSEEEWVAFAEDARFRIASRLIEMAPEADTDEDGQIDAEELEAFRTEWSAKVRAHCLERNPQADTDGDGGLSAEEFEAFRAQRAEEHRTRILERHPEADLDGDGTLSQEEMRSFRGTGQGHHWKMDKWDRRGRPHAWDRRERTDRSDRRGQGSRGVRSRNSERSRGPVGDRGSDIED